jgi:hypothetical protein
MNNKKLFITEIIYFGQKTRAICDKKCNKAWGINSRPKKQIDKNDIDDYYFLSDNDLKEAPKDPGTYEGECCKPSNPDKHNKWCVRECERCGLFKANEEIKLNDFSKKVYNKL